MPLRYRTATLLPAGQLSSLGNIAVVDAKDPRLSQQEKTYLLLEK